MTVGERAFTVALTKHQLTLSRLSVAETGLQLDMLLEYCVSELQQGEVIVLLFFFLYL